jgi:ADP-ribose pyrophosphatase YjhB (NUDIX family)
VRRKRLTFDVPAGFADPDAIPRHYQQDADPALVSAIAGVRPVRLAAVLVPIIDGDEPSVLFTKRTAHLNDHAGQISFPGGKIDAGDDSPTAAALREAEEEIALARNFVRPIGGARGNERWLSMHRLP